MEQILSELREKIGEQELRAAVWKLLDDGTAEFHRDRLRQLVAA